MRLVLTMHAKMCAENNIGVEGARALAEALRFNITLKTLTLSGSTLFYCVCSIHSVV